MIVSTDSWIEAALEEGSTKLAALIISLPPSSSQPTAATMAQTSSLESRVFALRLVSQDHSAGGDPEMAVELATVGISFCQRAFEQDGPGEADAFIFGVAQFSVDAHRAYDRLDRHTEQLAVLEEGLQWLTERGAEERNLIDLQFGRIEALIELGRLEEARDGLNAEVKEGRSGHSLYPILNQRLGTRLISAVERRDDRSIE